MSDKSEHMDHNALLLQVMAHDLLSPLTTTKWQTELLQRVEKDGAKRLQYIQNIQDSTQLGITLTKHAHVAGRVLVGAYDQDIVDASLPDTVRGAAEDVELQFERHNLGLDISVEGEEGTRKFDVELISLFVWSVAKYFLSCTPAGAAVSIRGMQVPNTSGRNMYAYIVSAPGVPEAEECAQIYVTQRARGTYDQTYVFAKLIHDIAQLIGASVNITAQNNLLVVEAGFDEEH